ncbi:unnamed protein product [Amoebophrya sp. A120]|nr:unnamed protein product [Amoebophrya sp. A120]|eukprot:GSA120T00017886001.1
MKEIAKAGPCDPDLELEDASCSAMAEQKKEDQKGESRRSGRECILEMGDSPVLHGATPVSSDLSTQEPGIVDANTEQDTRQNRGRDRNTKKIPCSSPSDGQDQELEDGEPRGQTQLDNLSISPPSSCLVAMHGSTALVDRLGRGTTTTGRPISQRSSSSTSRRSLSEVQRLRVTNVLLEQEVKTEKQDAQLRDSMLEILFDKLDEFHKENAMLHDRVNQKLDAVMHEVTRIKQEAASSGARTRGATRSEAETSSATDHASGTQMPLEQWQKQHEESSLAAFAAAREQNAEQRTVFGAIYQMWYETQMIPDALGGSWIGGSKLRSTAVLALPDRDRSLDPCASGAGSKAAESDTTAPATSGASSKSTLPPPPATKCADEGAQSSGDLPSTPSAPATPTTAGCGSKSLLATSPPADELGHAAPGATASAIFATSTSASSTSSSRGVAILPASTAPPSSPTSSGGPARSASAPCSQNASGSSCTAPPVRFSHPGPKSQLDSTATGTRHGARSFASKLQEQTVITTRKTTGEAGTGRHGTVDLVNNMFTPDGDSLFVAHGHLEYARTTPSQKHNDTGEEKARGKRGSFLVARR